MFMNHLSYRAGRTRKVLGARKIEFQELLYEILLKYY